MFLVRLASQNALRMWIWPDFKAEYLQHHYDNAHIPLRSRLIANLTSMQKAGYGSAMAL